MGPCVKSSHCPSRKARQGWMDVFLVIVAFRQCPWVSSVLPLGRVSLYVCTFYISVCRAQFFPSQF